MSDKFQNRYRIPSARLQNWDYGSNAIYFITICTAHREYYFGDIVPTNNQPQMQLSEIGKIAKQYWIEIPNHFPFVILGEWEVMPNHIHGIIIIDKQMDNALNNDVTVNGDGIGNANANGNGDVNANVIGNANDDVNANVKTPKLGVSTTPSVDSIIPTTNQQRTKNASEKWNPETLGVIINQYKRIVTINARNIDADFGWQSRFHDHIIRNEESFQRISNYIINNPSKWADDKFNNLTSI